MRPLSWSSSYLLRDPLGISTTTGTPASGSVPDEAEELIALDLLAPVQEAELDEGGDADHLAAEPLDQPGGGPRGAAGGEHVVHDQHPLAGGDRVGVELDGAAAEVDDGLVDDRGEGDLVGEQRGDVLEHDALLGEVRHVADQRPQALDVDGHDDPPCRWWRAG